MPFGIDKNQSLKSIISQCRDKLEWATIELIPDSEFDLHDFLVTHKTYSIKEVVQPPLSRRQFMVYADQITTLLRKKILALQKDKRKLREEKVKILMFCKNFCWSVEQRYNAGNVFSLANDFDWRIESKGEFVGIPFPYIDISKQINLIAEELALRMYFFQWARIVFESALNELEEFELHDPLIQWKTEGAKLKVAEILYALEKSEVYEFCEKSSKKIFLQYIEKLFNLGKTNWSDLESDIRKRKSKEDKTKWFFLTELNQTNI